MSTDAKGEGFTPGPWTAVSGQGVHYRDWYIRAGERQPGSWPAVAKCCSSRIGGLIAVTANARLIAASPALYAACKAAQTDNAVYGKLRPETVAQIAAALALATEGAKAEGGGK